MKTILNFRQFVNESLNEGKLPSYVKSGPYQTLKDMFAYIGNDIQNADGSELTIADVNKNYKPALKYLGVRSIADMGMIGDPFDDNDDSDELYDIVAPQMKSSNFLGNDGGKGMNSQPYTGAYKGKVGDIKVIITQDINGENTFVYAAVDSRGNINESLNENLNEGKLPSWVQSGPYTTLSDVFRDGGGYDTNGKELTMADVNKNYKPALKYLGVRSIADMVMVATTNDDEKFDPKDKKADKLGSNGDYDGPATGMWPSPYTAAYKGMLGDVKVVVLSDERGEGRYAFAAGDSKGNVN